MATYNQAATTYDEIDTLYDGVELGATATLVLNGADVTSVLRRGSLAVHVAAHGNSLGTLDAELLDPAVLPADGDAVVFYVATTRRYGGTVRATATRAFRGGHLFASFGAQDAGPDLGLPSASPWDLSDTPNGTTTRGYASLARATRTTEGGTPKVTYAAEVREGGLWVNHNVDVTSAAYGLSADEMTVTELTLRWSDQRAPPAYSLVLGDALVSLAQMLSEPNLAPGSITSTAIADGAISTPKLAANAVVANLVNVAGHVVIGDAGVEITDGALVVRNTGGTAIIDGESDMFRIAATGTIHMAAGPIANGSEFESVDVATGFTYPPVVLGFAEWGANSSTLLPYILWDAGVVLDVHAISAAVVFTNQTRVGITWSATTDRSGASMDYRYYILEQTGI